jgi:hypothetical protein
MTALPPVLSQYSSAIFLRHIPLSFPQEKIEGTSQKFYYFKFLNVLNIVYVRECLQHILSRGLPKRYPLKVYHEKFSLQMVTEVEWDVATLCI